VERRRPAHPALLGKPVTGHASAVDSAVFSPDGRTLASGSLDDTIRLWNITDPAPLGGPLTTPNRIVFPLVFSPDGYTLASGRYTQIQLWDLNADHAIARICASTAGALTPQVWNRYLPHLPYDPPCHRA
jgi:WD40 repeat protein